MQSPYVVKIEIPMKLSALLQKAPGATGLIERAVNLFSVWLADNKTPLFFEYTDHGVAHIVNVLRSVETLIPGDVWEILTPQDAEAIIAAILLHDCAMHLSVDGFLNLIRADSPSSKIAEQERSWADEYARFEQEAGRWDAQKLMSVFGDMDPIQPLDASGVLSDRQKMMVGEFLRRNHARLAHEIALDGVPGPADQERFSPFRDFEQERRDLFGFIARSHNMPIREAADLIPRMRRRRFLDVHAPYLMAILRVADYVQIDAARAPTQILQLRGLKSPLSRSEWAKHHAVLELHQLGDDPEALNVVADPKDIYIFSGLRKLFKDLQRELDESWALLGEVYGRVPDLDKLGLTVRRLISNLDDSREFEAVSKPNFIPNEIRLTTASAELLHLLVGPLYGNKPSVGVRELVQNAVDATLEMQHQSKGIFQEEYQPCVEVELDIANPEDSYLRVTDNGVGMSLEVVEEFFLRAGASFRRSAWWGAQYTDNNGGAAVRRSGRFGVGALAAFLVGPEIFVTTRSFLDKSSSGLRFRISLDDDLIEISRVKANVGTSIEVKIVSEDVKRELIQGGGEQKFYEWFLYDSPRIIYRIHKDSEWNEVKPRWMTSKDLITSDSKWCPVAVGDFESVFWSYDTATDYYHVSRLSCNGIHVASGGYRRDLPEIVISHKSSPFNVRHPDLLVNDRDGKLPLNVQRNGLAESRYPFQLELEESIAELYVRDLHRCLLIKAEPAHIPAALQRVKSVSRAYGAGYGSPVALHDDGWLLTENAIFPLVERNVIVAELFDSHNFGGYINSMNNVEGMTLLPVLGGSSGQGIVVAFVRSLFDVGDGGIQNPVRAVADGIGALHLYVNDSVDNALKKKAGLPQYIFRKLREVMRTDGWVVYESGSSRDPATPHHEVIEAARKTESRAFAYLHMKPVESSIEATVFSRKWVEEVPEILVINERLVGFGPEDEMIYRDDDSAEDVIFEGNPQVS